VAVTELFRCRAASRPLHFGEECGDHHLIAPFSGGVLLAVSDGLGHGWEAAQASQAALEVLRREPAARLEHLIAECHRRLRETRGAALSLVQLHFERARLTWFGVGNVEALLLRPDGTRERILIRGGVVGYHLPPIRPVCLDIQAGDCLVMATDGLSSEISTELAWHEVSGAEPQVLLERFSKGTDDALVLVAEVLQGKAVDEHV
jgi:negative regulator of sigma-B (phosphoserine phosphatase)